MLCTNIFGQKKPIIKYIALGDSYTICEGINTEDCWPNLLVSHLNNEEITIQLVANPSVTGYTSQDLIDHELPLLNEETVDFATILIGVNDWVKGVNSSIFKSNLTYIVETVIEKVGSNKRLLLITIPDFSATPEGVKYGKGRNISEGIAEFNQIIHETALLYGIKLVDIYPTTQEMQGEPSLIAKDGLHPSAEEYALWEALIYKEVKKLLTK